MVDNDNIKQAALSLLDRGLVTVAEAAWLARKSRQTMRNWAGAKHTKAVRGIPEARAKHLQAEWNKTLKLAKAGGVEG